nr:hypothetical protein [Akkermansiaceae bacterium]
MTAILYLLPLGLIFDLIGYLPPTGRSAVVYALLALPLLLRPSRQCAWLAGALAVAAVVRSWLPLSPLADTLWLLLMHQALWTVLGPVPRALRAGTAAYGMLHVILFLSPLGHPVTEALAAACNAVAGVLTKAEFNLGPSFHGVGGMVLFFTLLVFLAGRSPQGWLRVAAFVPLALLVNTLGAVLLLEKATLVGQDDLTKNFAWTLKFRDKLGFPELWAYLKDLAVVFYPRVLFIAQMLVFLTLHRWRWSKDPEAVAAPAGWGALRGEFAPGARRWLAAGAAVVLALLLAPPTVWRPLKDRDIVFVEKGVVSYSKPDYQRFGEYAGGMFGMMPDYARLFGHKSVVVKDIPETLDPKQILVLTSLDMDLGEEVRRRIWDFVEKGGGLWVLGDHTFIKNGRNHLNDLLEPSHIRFVNDSAQMITQGWFHGYRFPQGTPFANLREDAENRPGILVGASLELRAPAHPLVVGVWGYGDLGTDTPDDKRGNLGDFKYQRKERLGDLVLVAGERYGKGRVLVYGDTSSFFNGNLPRAHEILAANFAWLSESNLWLAPAGAAGRSLAALLAAAVLGLAFWRRGETGGAAILAAVGAYAVVGLWDTGLPRVDRDFGRRHLAIVDFSLQPNASKHSATDAGLHGINLNLLRHGKLPIAMNRWDGDLLD